MKYIVTGGAGFIGSHLVDFLIKDGGHVKVIDNLSTGNPENLTQHKGNRSFEFIDADIADLEGIKGYFKDIDVVFHIAGLADIVPSIVKPAQYYRSNVTGTFAVMEASRLAGVRKVIYAASSSCYGIPEACPTPEAAKADPKYPYALTKYLGEQIALH
jgi:UDP-glucose 4-epimerase